MGNRLVAIARLERLAVRAEVATATTAAATTTEGLLRLGFVDVDLATKTVRITLPRAQVLTARVDNARTYVHTRATDLLANEQLNLESSARQEAERTFQQAALDGGILVAAERSARKTVHALLTSLGFSTIEIQFRGEAAPATSR